MKEVKLFTRNFTLVVIGQIISLFGNAILRFALPLYLLRQTGSASLFGMVTACSFLPMIVLSLLGGVLADRVNKRNIMVILDFSTGGIIFVFSLLLGNVSIVPLLIGVLMLLYGIQGAYQPAVQASIPAIVHKDKILPANAVVNQISALANLLGPIAGGILYSVFGIRLILIISIVCFLLSAAMELFITIPFEKRKAEKSLWRVVEGDLKESLGFIKNKQPVFFKVAVMVAFFNWFVSSMLTVGLPYLLVDTLNINDNLFGISQGVMAFGGLAGGMFTGMLGSRLRLEKAHIILLVCSFAALPMSLTLMAGLPAPVSYVIITAMSFLCMGCAAVFTIQVMSFVQMNTPKELAGKVISALIAVSMCAQPIGQAMYGFLFEGLKHNPGIGVLLAFVSGTMTALYSRRVFNGFRMNHDSIEGTVS